MIDFSQAEWSFGNAVTLQWLNRSLDLVYGNAGLSWDVDLLKTNGLSVISDLYSIEQSAAARCRHVTNVLRIDE